MTTTAKQPTQEFPCMDCQGECADVKHHHCYTCRRAWRCPNESIGFICNKPIAQTCYTCRPDQER